MLTRSAPSYASTEEGDEVDPPDHENGDVHRYELWQNDEGYSFFPEHNHQARDMAQADGQRLTWEVVAKGLNSANQLLYDHLGFGVYRPMLQADGTPYPQDEDDDYVATGEFNG